MASKIAVLTSRFNEPVTSKLKAGAKKRIQELPSQDYQFNFFDVPGAYELPLAAQWCLTSGYSGVVVLGAVIKGETSHYDFVCASVERGCSRLQLDFQSPVVFGVLTTETAQQAWDRCGGKKGNKGEEAIDVLIEMLELKKNLI